MAEILRDIKRRIRVVRNTYQITKAMEMVAAARLKRAEVALSSIRYFTKNLEECLKVVSDIQHFFEPTHHSPILIVISADRGLCGAYNSNIIKATEHFLSKNNVTKIYCIGRKITQYLLKTIHKDKVIQLSLSTRPTYYELKNVFSEILKEVNLTDIYVIFTEFISTTKCSVRTVSSILPFDKDVADNRELRDDKYELFLFEPPKEQLMKPLIERYGIARLCEYYFNAKSSEEASRMLAMQQANKNALEMIDHLTLLFNKARQAAITKEILEVVSAAEALK